MHNQQSLTSKLLIAQSALKNVFDTDNLINGEFSKHNLVMKKINTQTTLL